MANQSDRNKNRAVGSARAKLAPQPMANPNYHVMPSIRQQYVIEPTFVTKETPLVANNNVGSAARENTLADYQPKKEDTTKKWKRKKRAANAVIGIIALAASLAVLLPYVLGFLGKSLDAPIVLSFSTFNSIGALVEGVPQVISLGIFQPESNGVLVTLVPHAILAIGILAVAINAIKSVFALLFMKKPVKYTTGATVNLVCVLAILIASLVGAPLIRINQVDFMADVVYGYANSELFTLVAFAVAYSLVSAICALINRDKCGYLK